MNGEIYFPNVHLESTLIDFGCILNNTEVVQHIKMTNKSPLIVNYKWKFILEKDNVISLIEEQNIENEHAEQEREEVIKNSKLEELIKPMQSDLPSIEEIFDISPLYGNLHPGETQVLTITYYGHKEIKSYVKAVCEVKNGPDYELLIKGEASVLNYELSNKSIDLGCIPFDQVAESFLTIKNIGKVTIKYNMIGFDFSNTTDAVLIDDDQSQIESDRPMIFPPEGYIEADRTETIVVKYLAGVPRKFKRTFHLQISHFAPEEITISGEATFADIMLDLPRLETETYKTIRKEAQQIIKSGLKHSSFIRESFELSEMMPDIHLQVEIDRLAVENQVKRIDNSTFLNGIDENKPVIINDNNNEFMKSMTSVNLVNNQIKKNSASVSAGFIRTPLSNTKKSLNFTQRSTSSSSLSSGSSSKKRGNMMSKITLPDYILDFGHVILGTVKTHVIRANNKGKVAASFEIERQNFAKTGFLIDLGRVQNLPNEESVEFVITFDPRGANLGLGIIEHVIPINVSEKNCKIFVN